MAMIEQRQAHDWVFDQLGRYLDIETTEEETKAIAQHISECAICQQRLIELRRVEQAYVRWVLQTEPNFGDQMSLTELSNPKIKTRRYDLVTESDLANLANFHADSSPVVSLYLDLRPEERQRENVRQKFTHLIDEKRRSMMEQSTSKARQRAFDAEVERLMTWFSDTYDGTGKSLAIFTATENNLWRAFRLPAPVNDRLIVADRPYVRPLVTLTDEYERYLILLVNKKIARLFVVYLGEIEEYTELVDELVPHSKAGGQTAEKYQRTHNMHVLWHVKHVVKAAEELFRREQCDWLLMGGAEEAMAELREQLPKAMQEVLAGELAIALKASPDQVLSEATKLEQANEARIENKRVETLLSAALGKKQGVLGLDDTLAAIVEGKAMMLVVVEDFHQAGFECPNCHFLVGQSMERCPLCGTQLDPQVDIVERAIQRALEQDAAVEVLRSAARERLVPYGSIGVLERYSEHKAIT